MTPLTAHQRRCLQAVADGLTMTEYARQSQSPFWTVAYHVKQARQALGALTTPQAVGIAVKLGEVRVRVPGGGA